MERERRMTLGELHCCSKMETEGSSGEVADSVQVAEMKVRVELPMELVQAELLSGNAGRERDTWLEGTETEAEREEARKQDGQCLLVWSLLETLLELLL